MPRTSWPRSRGRRRLLRLSHAPAARDRPGCTSLVTSFDSVIGVCRAAISEQPGRPLHFCSNSPCRPFPVGDQCPLRRKLLRVKVLKESSASLLRDNPRNRTAPARRRAKPQRRVRVPFAPRTVLCARSGVAPWLGLRIWAKVVAYRMPSATTEFRSTPMPGISISTVSPTDSGPTPAGVPVMIRSPGRRVMNLLR